VKDISDAQDIGGEGMLLAIDVGNTNIVLGVYEGDELATSWRLSTSRIMTADEYGILILNLFGRHKLKTSQVSAIIISCVVPPLMPTLEQVAQKYFHVEPLIVEPGIKTGMPLMYENPKEVGADRIVNAVAGYEKYGGPLIIVDFGTATTFCVVSARGEYLGGAITAGLGIASESLFQRTARLPRIELIKPRQVIGRSTVVSMQSGLIYGYIGQVEGLIQRITHELGGFDEPTVVATGGIASLIAPECRNIHYIDQNLTMEGLRIIYQKNKESRAER
jgi:type III pantothenate kinase